MLPAVDNLTQQIFLGLKYFILYYFSLHQEINDFFKWMVPTPEEHEMRIGVVKRIEKCIQVV